VHFAVATGISDATFVRLNAVNDGASANVPMELSATKFNFAIGNVGIGTTSPTAKLQITSTSAGAATVALFLNNNSVTSSTETRIAFAANTNDDIASGRYSYISALNTSGVNGQALIFATNETGNSAVERMRITSGGNVLIGTTTDNGSKLQVEGNTTSGISYRLGTYTNGSTTPSVSGISFLSISNSSATSITNFTGAVNGQIITLQFGDSNTTITRNNAYLSLGINFTSTANDTITLIYLSSLWYEVSRSINA
jgi:hypothetical protein